jgi:hypothetical protein
MAHLPRLPHVEPHAAAIRQAVRLALVEPRCPFEAIQLLQQLGADGIQLTLEAVLGIAAGDGHREGAQVV